MKKSDWIAYVGAFHFPEGQAGSRRVYGIARSLVNAGYNVTVGSGNSLPSTPELLYEDEHGSLTHVGLGELTSKSAHLVQRTTYWLVALGSHTIDWLERQPTKPACVILYGLSTSFALRLLGWCRRHRVPLIFDVVEWYDSSHLPGGTFGPSNITAKTALRLLHPRGSGIIAISSYLEDYYRQRGCLTVRVPPTLDVMQVEARLTPATSKRPLTLAYTGIPGWLAIN